MNTDGAIKDPQIPSDEALQRELSLLTSAFDVVTEGMIVLDLDDNIRTYNKKFVEIWSIPDEAIRESNTGSILQHVLSVLTKPEAFLEEIGRSPINTCTKTNWELKDGRIFEIHSQPHKLDDEIVGRLLSCRDITVRKRAIDELNKKESFLRVILENLTDSIVACDAQGNLTVFDGKSRDLDQPSQPPIPPEEWAERFELYRPDGKTLMKMKEVPLYRALHEGKVVDAELVTRSKDGQILTMLTTGQSLIDENDNKLGAVVVMHDITKRKKSEDALRENESKLRNLLQSMSEGLLEVDENEVIVFANDRFCEMSGYTQEELLGKVTLDLFFEENERKFIGKANRQRRKGIPGHYEMALRTKSGEKLHVIIGGTPLMTADGRFSGTMGVFTDITDRKRAEEQMLYDAFHDGLTGLANRAFFMEHLQLTIEQARRGKRNLFAVLFFDFDRFKVINDSLGHAAGDKLLKRIAERLETSLRAGDLVARLGGDEFTILANGLSSQQSTFLLAERIQEDLRRPFDIDGREIFTSASIGIAFCTPGISAQEMLRDADIAMYRAKARGKARFEVFDKEMHENAIKRLQLETELRQALERKEFCVFYQPIVDIETNTLKSFEALIRWNHPRRGLVSPMEFIPAAEENNMILAIGKWTLFESCRQMRQWQKDMPAARDLRISVNLSVKEFLQFDLAEQVVETLKKTGLNPRCLKLEITESHVMENSGMAIAMMNRLRDIGVQLSLDDFGTGYSSLSHLHRLPVSFLKVDRSFISRMTDSDENREIVNTIIRLAQNLKMKVVAEGIETAEQLELLRILGCEYGQGYFFAKPLDAENAARFIQTPEAPQALFISPTSKEIITLDDSLHH